MTRRYEQMIESLGTIADDSWAQHAQTMSALKKGQAATVAASAASTTAAAATTAAVVDLAGGVQAMHAALDTGLGHLGAQMGQANATLASIADAVHNPLAARAGERFRRALDLHHKGLLPEAHTEYLASLRHDPYNPLTLFLAAYTNEDLPGAAAQYANAFRYAQAEQHRPLAAAALTKAIDIHEHLGNTTEAARLADTSAYHQYPEIWIAYGRLHGKPQDVAEAVRWAPDLALPAVAEYPQAAAAVATIAADPDSAVGMAKDLAEEVRAHYTLLGQDDLAATLPTREQIEAMPAPVAFDTATVLFAKYTPDHLDTLASAARTRASTLMGADRWREATQAADKVSVARMGVDSARLFVRGGWAALAVLVLLLLFVPDKTPGFFGTIGLWLLFAALAVAAFIGIVIMGVMLWSEKSDLRRHERAARPVNDTEAAALAMDTDAACRHLDHAKVTARLVAHRRPEQFTTVG